MAFDLYLPIIRQAWVVSGQEPEYQLNAAERLLTTLIEGHPDQGRPFMQLDARLVKAAQSKVLDMAVREYEGHTDPDGDGPNRLVEEFGYQLPDWYNPKQNANSVESLLWGGTGDHNNAWSIWLGSPPHRIHLLGQNKFYGEQTNYGVGYVYVPGSRLGHYYAVISAPPETS
jgi:uncharacterized protein YkwD